MERLLHTSVALVFAFIVIGLWWEGGYALILYSSSSSSGGSVVQFA